MQNIKITNEGKIIETREIDGQDYFRQQERELTRVDQQIARLQEVRQQILERLKKKPQLEKVIEQIEEKKQEVEKENISETEESDVLISD